MLFLGAIGAEAQHYDRGYEKTPSSPFLKKGTWMAGGTARYSQHINDDFNFLVINDINSKGYNISVNPKLLYLFRDNMGVGLRFSYDRSMLDLTGADLSVSDISMNAKDCYQIQHKYSVHGKMGSRVITPDRKCKFDRLSHDASNMTVPPIIN